MTISNFSRHYLVSVIIVLLSVLFAEIIIIITHCCYFHYHCHNAFVSIVRYMIMLNRYKILFKTFLCISTGTVHTKVQVLTKEHISFIYRCFRTENITIGTLRRVHEYLQFQYLPPPPPPSPLPQLKNMQT